MRIGDDGPVREQTGEARAVAVPDEHVALLTGDPLAKSAWHHRSAMERPLLSCLRLDDFFGEELDGDEENKNGLAHADNEASVASGGYMLTPSSSAACRGGTLLASAARQGQRHPLLRRDEATYVFQDVDCILRAAYCRSFFALPGAAPNVVRRLAHALAAGSRGSMRWGWGRCRHPSPRARRHDISEPRGEGADPFLLGNVYPCKLFLTYRCRFCFAQVVCQDASSDAERRWCHFDRPRLGY